jgi:molybdopterin-containing oxidoreductase family iron-sulfur binding subunit
MKLNKRGDYMTDKRLVMIVDIKRCIGCHTCSIACKSGNNLPNEVWWNRAITFGGVEMDTPYGDFPGLQKQYLTLACQQCENPACVKACPAEATYKREDGIVIQDYNKCLGCRLCIMACPYDSVRIYNNYNPKYYLDFPVGDKGVNPQQKGTVSKCNFCADRIDNGLLPNCVEVCPAKARFFGNIEDPESEVFKLLKANKSIQLLQGKGTNPSVFFLV